MVVSFANPNLPVDYPLMRMDQSIYLLSKFLLHDALQRLFVARQLSVNIDIVVILLPLEVFGLFCKQGILVIDWA